MRILKYFILVAMIIGGLCFSGCSGETENPVPEPKVEEKGAIRKMTDKTAHQITGHIRKPINKAINVKTLMEEKYENTYTEE